MINVYAEPMRSLLDPEETVPRSFFKDAVLENMRHTELVGVPQNELSIDLDAPDGSDILVKRVDPEKALGYKVFQSESDYFKKLELEMMIPSLDQILGARSG